VKIAIVCGSPSSEMLAPFDDSSWQIWALGNRIQRYPRVNRIFEIHDDLSEHGDPLKYAEYLANMNIPMTVGEKFPVDAPHINAFDFEQSKGLFGSLYLTSSTAYMLSKAISDGATEIGIYGVDMAVDAHEYFWQRPCVEAWIGFAKAKGIKVYIPPVSPVLRNDYVEGMGCGGKPDFSHPPFTQAEFLALATVHADKISQIKRQIDLLRADLNTHDGCRQVYERLAQVARATEAGQSISSLSHTTIIK
jgi:hypothetical protein